MRRLIAALAFALTASPAAAADRPPSAASLFGSAYSAASGAPRAIGSYAKGCLAGGVQLAPDGPGWAAMRLSRGRNWGHPELAAFVIRLSEAATRAGMTGLLIGDMGQPRGGPMESGHRSHQIGLDVDIWLRPMTARPGASQREFLSSFDVVEGRSGFDEALWARSSWRAIPLAAKDPAVARIFVNAAIKRKLCATAPAGDRAWLRKVRPWWGHDSHFHVRLACPRGVAGCTDQPPPPAGDGCGKELDWWFTDEPYSGTSKPKPKLTLADLPSACRAVLEAE